MLKVLFCLIFALATLAADTQDIDAFNKPLKFSTTSLCELLALDPTMPGFIPVSFRESIGANAIGLTGERFFEDRAVLVAEKTFERFCSQSQVTSSSPFSIPHFIHLIWLGSTPPPTVEIVIASWRKYHPDWEIKLWTDQEIACFPWSNPRSELFFKEAKNWAEKSDILRFEILYQFGGVYSDTDVICLKPFDDLLQGLTFFACFQENKVVKKTGRPLIGSAIIGAARNHPILNHCLDYSQIKEEAPGLTQDLRSGPGPITKASYEALESGENDILILPCSYFYPLPYLKRLASLDEIKESIRPESFAIHLWEASWF